MAQEARNEFEIPVNKVTVFSLHLTFLIPLQVLHQNVVHTLSYDIVVRLTRYSNRLELQCQRQREPTK